MQKVGELQGTLAQAANKMMDMRAWHTVEFVGFGDGYISVEVSMVSLCLWDEFSRVDVFVEDATEQDVEWAKRFMAVLNGAKRDDSGKLVTCTVDETVDRLVGKVLESKASL